MTFPGHTEHPTENIIGYALNALEPIERSRTEDLLESCPPCRAELDSTRETLAALVAEDGPGPAELWDRIAGSLDRSVVPLPAPRRRLQRMLAAAAVVAIAVLVGTVVAQRIVIGNLDRLAASAEAAADAPGAIVAELRVPDQEEIIAEVVYLPDGTGYLVSDQLPALSADRTYQLWAVVDGTVVSAGVLGNDPGVVAFRMAGDVDTFALTEEIAGGVVVSEGPAIAVWQRTG